MIGGAGLAFRLILLDAVSAVTDALPIILAEARALLLSPAWMLLVAFYDLMSLRLNLSA